jgi:hypothetical protein
VVNSWERTAVAESALLVFVPEIGPSLVERTLLRRGDHRLVLRPQLGVAFDHRSQSLLHRLLFGHGFAQHVLPNNVAAGDGTDTKIAEHANAGQPMGRDVLGAGIHRTHVLDRKQAHAGQSNEQESDDG